MGDRNNKAIDRRAVNTANNSRKIGAFIDAPRNRKERRAKEAAEQKAGALRKAMADIETRERFGTLYDEIFGGQS